MKKKFKRSTGPHMAKNPPLEPKQRVCGVCGRGGSTLEKDNGSYKHQNPAVCEMIKRMEQREEAAKKAEDQREADEYVRKLKAEEKNGQAPAR